MTSKPTAAQLLPMDRQFQDLLFPYLAPYLIYVALSSIPETVVPAALGQAMKLVFTGAAMLFFRDAYRLGPFKPIHGVIAVLALPAALLFWVAPFYLLTALGLTDVVTASGDPVFSSVYFFLKLANSAILVAIFEELFIRVYVMGWFYQAGPQRQKKGLIASIVDTLDQHPAFLAVLPLSTFSVVGATIVFSAGHRAYEYLSAVLYFLFTTWLYKKSGSLWVCIIIHGLTNLAIGLAVKYGGMGWLW